MTKIYKAEEKSTIDDYVYFETVTHYLFQTKVDLLSFSSLR